MKYYTNPKYSEYSQDELFVQKTISDRKSQERKDAVTAVLGIAIAAAVLMSSWIAIIFLEG